MRTSVIRQRVADFLKQHAPFDTLHEADLLDLAGSGKVKFHESEEYVFRQGDPKGHFVWTIQQGRVELLEESTTGEHLRDVLGEGDLLGLERFAGDGSCLYSARTASDVILYGVAAAQFESTVDRYPSVRRFLAARVSVSGNLGFNRTSWLEADAPPIAFLRARLAGTAARCFRERGCVAAGGVAGAESWRWWMRTAVRRGRLRRSTVCSARTRPGRHDSAAPVASPLSIARLCAKCFNRARTSLRSLRTVLATADWRPSLPRPKWPCSAAATLCV